VDVATKQVTVKQAWKIQWNDVGTNQGVIMHDHTFNETVLYHDQIADSTVVGFNPKIMSIVIPKAELDAADAVLVGSTPDASGNNYVLRSAGFQRLHLIRDPQGQPEQQPLEPVRRVRREVHRSERGVR
jgi:hypothetical protein